MISPASPFDITGIFSAAASRVQQGAQGFAELLAGTSASSESPAAGVSDKDVTSQLIERFEKLLEQMRIDPKQSLGLEIDASGDVWVQEGAGEKRVELEAAIADDPALKQLMGRWADQFGAPNSSATFRWPQRVDASGAFGAY